LELKVVGSVCYIGRPCDLQWTLTGLPAHNTSRPVTVVVEPLGYPAYPIVISDAAVVPGAPSGSTTFGHSWIVPSATFLRATDATVRIVIRHALTSVRVESDMAALAIAPAFRWHASNFGSCSATCGVGVLVRNVTCEDAQREEEVCV